MRTATLNTQDHRCPEVMIMSRRFMREELNDDVVCEITTIEPSALRDIPYYCDYQGYELLDSTEKNGQYTFKIATKAGAECAKLERPSNVISVFNVNTYHAQRDAVLSQKFATLVDEFKTLMNADFQLVFPCSFGKDSKVVLTGGLAAHEALMRDPTSKVNADTPFVVIHIDTGIEVVPMDMYSNHAMKSLRKYCKTKGINLQLHHKKPPLHEQFTSLFIGARKLPSTPAMNSDCAVIWKVDQSEAIQRQLIKEYGANKLVSCLGSRDDEGAKRAASLKKHGNRDKTVLSLLRENKQGLQTFAPIIDWSNEDVFELLQRCGVNPQVRPTPGYAYPAFMPSYRLLVQIYGDSSNDICEINLGDTSKQAGCNGSARNGCHQCFKAGKHDSSAHAHNSNIRWGNIQANATLVRDWVYSIAHDSNYRTHHPRTFDPITNHAILQPNILSARTLERMLTYYVQITHDDEVRAERFTALVKNGAEMEDEGFASIANDTSMDDATRAEFMDMYREQAQRHLLQIATLKHCLFLSAQWSMDGVKSLPYRPLAIWNNVVNKGKRIPYPSISDRPVKTSPIGDAMTVKMCEPGVDLLAQWVPPFREWDLIEPDMNEGCSTQSMPHSLRVTVEYTQGQNEDALSVKHAGKTIQVGDTIRATLIAKAKERLAGGHTVNFSSFLTGRVVSSIGQKISDTPRKAHKIKNFTRRPRKLNKKTNTWVPGRTSLLMYKPQVNPSLAQSTLGEDNIWVPNTVKRVVPFIAQHQDDINDSSLNFHMDEQALADWYCTDGLNTAIAMHDRYARLTKQRRIKECGRYTLRQFHNTTAFWQLLQSSVISVNVSTWYTAQRVMKRTELFAEVGLFNFSDDADEIAACRGTLNMADHRNLKAQLLLDIRAKRNAIRQQVRDTNNAILSGNKDAIMRQLINRIDALANLRMQIAGPNYIDNALTVSAGVTGFDHKDYKTDALLADEWMLNYQESLTNVDAFISKFGTTHEKALIQNNLAAKIAINARMHALNNAFANSHQQQLTIWQRYSNELEVFRAQVMTMEQADTKILKAIRAVTDNFDGDISTLFYSGEAIASHLTGTTQRISDRLSSDPSIANRLLPVTFHQDKWNGFAHMLAGLIKQTHDMQQSFLHRDVIGNATGSARTAALLHLQVAA